MGKALAKARREDKTLQKSEQRNIHTGKDRLALRLKIKKNQMEGKDCTLKGALDKNLPVRMNELQGEIRCLRSDKAIVPTTSEKN